jgi:hypothetical protein
MVSHRKPLKRFKTYAGERLCDTMQTVLSMHTRCVPAIPDIVLYLLFHSYTFLVNHFGDAEALKYSNW